MRMSYGYIKHGDGELGSDMKGRNLRELLKERTQLKKAGRGGCIFILDRCICGCGGAHTDRNKKTIEW